MHILVVTKTLPQGFLYAASSRTGHRCGIFHINAPTGPTHQMGYGIALSLSILALFVDGEHLVPFKRSRRHILLAWRSIWQSSLLRPLVVIHDLRHRCSHTSRGRQHTTCLHVFRTFPVVRVTLVPSCFDERLYRWTVLGCSLGKQLCPSLSQPADLVIITIYPRTEV